MEEVSREGRTIIFVSHNIGAINQLTNKTIVLENGCLTFYGKTQDGIDKYMEKSSNNNSILALKTNDINFDITSFEYLEISDNSFNAPLNFKLSLDLDKKFNNVYMAVGIFNSIGSRILTAKNIFETLKKGQRILFFSIDDHHLPPGNYSISFGITTMKNNILYSENILSFTIDESGITDPLLIPYLSSHYDKIGAFYHLNISKECI